MSEHKPHSIIGLTEGEYSAQTWRCIAVVPTDEVASWLDANLKTHPELVADMEPAEYPNFKEVWSVPVGLDGLITGGSVSLYRRIYRVTKVKTRPSFPGSQYPTEWEHAWHPEDRPIPKGWKGWRNS